MTLLCEKCGEASYYTPAMGLDAYCEVCGWLQAIEFHNQPEEEYERKTTLRSPSKTSFDAEGTQAGSLGANDKKHK